jgi:ankyrin repeat protein
MMKLLLKKGADINEDEEDKTALHAAVKERDVAAEDAALRAACYGIEMAVSF